MLDVSSDLTGLGYYYKSATRGGCLAADSTTWWEMCTDQEEKRLARYLPCTQQHNEKLLWYWRIIVPVCMQVPCFFAVRVMVSLKVLQLELSPPHTPHLSSCFEEPTTPSQPTFCSWRYGKFSTCGSEKTCSHLTLSYMHTRTHTVPLTLHSPRTHTLWGSL